MDFYRDWADYKTGFGDVEHEYWLGNQNLHRLTSETSYAFRIDLEDWDNGTAYAEYDVFSVGSELDPGYWQTSYQLTVGGYAGTAGEHGRTT